MAKGADIADIARAKELGMDGWIIKSGFEKKQNKLWKAFKVKIKHLGPVGGGKFKESCPMV